MYSTRHEGDDDQHDAEGAAAACRVVAGGRGVIVPSRTVRSAAPRGSTASRTKVSRAERFEYSAGR